MGNIQRILGNVLERPSLCHTLCMLCFASGFWATPTADQGNLGKVHERPSLCHPLRISSFAVRAARAHITPLPRLRAAPRVKEISRHLLCIPGSNLPPPAYRLCGDDMPAYRLQAGVHKTPQHTEQEGAGNTAHIAKEAARAARAARAAAGSNLCSRNLRQSTTARRSCH